jgi:glycosyltransferase involved in cell wall biosynthesis
MKISVLICTRNRAGSLDATLTRFFSQRFSGEYASELLVVDNGSTDGTRLVAERCRERHPESVRYLFEARRGLSFARNAGLSAARGEIIVFTDDDVLVSEDWLDQIHREFLNDLELQMLSGRVLLANERLQKVAMQTYQDRGYHLLPDGISYAMGANMAFRRDLFDRIGGFDVRLGSGRFFAGADEAELVYRGLKSGSRLLYAPNVLVYHDHDRLTLGQACRLEYGYAKGCAAYLIKHALGGDGYAMRMLYWTLRSLPKRWRRKAGEDRDTVIRRHWHIGGMLVGLFTAPFVMWGKGIR